MTEQEIKSAIYETATRLDIYYINWHNKIDLNRLDIACPYNCIVAQLTGYFKPIDFRKSIGYLSQDDGGPFFIGIGGYVGVDINKINLIWRAEILHRRNLEKSALTAQQVVVKCDLSTTQGDLNVLSTTSY
jgi:hypothetical protein